MPALDRVAAGVIRCEVAALGKGRRECLRGRGWRAEIIMTAMPRVLRSPAA